MPKIIINEMTVVKTAEVKIEKFIVDSCVAFTVDLCVASAATMVVNSNVRNTVITMLFFII